MFPKQQRRPLPSLLSLSFFYDLDVVGAGDEAVLLKATGGGDDVGRVDNGAGTQHVGHVGVLNL